MAPVDWWCQHQSINLQITARTCLVLLLVSVYIYLHTYTVCINERLLSQIQRLYRRWRFCYSNNVHTCVHTYTMFSRFHHPFSLSHFTQFLWRWSEEACGNVIFAGITPLHVREQLLSGFVMVCMYIHAVPVEKVFSKLIFLCVDKTHLLTHHYHCHRQLPLRYSVVVCFWSTVIAALLVLVFLH